MVNHDKVRMRKSFLRCKTLIILYFHLFAIRAGRICKSEIIAERKQRCQETERWRFHKNTNTIWRDGDMKSWEQCNSDDWRDGEMARRQDGKMARWRADACDGEMARLVGEIVRTNVKMARWRDGELARLQVDKMARWRDDEMNWRRDGEIGWRDGEMARWREHLPRWRVCEMARWRDCK